MARRLLWAQVRTRWWQDMEVAVREKTGAKRLGLVSFRFVHLGGAGRWPHRTAKDTLATLTAKMLGERRAPFLRCVLIRSGLAG